MTEEVAGGFAQLVRADNPNMMTLDGTNTWILRGPESKTSVVVDPGPLDEGHLAAVHEAAGDVELVLYTHHHFDHTECIDRFAELTGAPARAIGEEWCRDAEPLSDGELLDVAGLALEIVAVPGHTTDSMAILVTEDGSLLTGDTVLGRGTTVIAWPDGVLGPYLDSLARIRELVLEGAATRFLPGHGPVVDDPLVVIDYYIEHRFERLDQVRSAVAGGASTPREVVEVAYADVGQHLWPAAEMSVRAQLDFLNAE
ncbi:MAG TPA: MBL fold metallo-hydrolase [Aeromicrobium sp.]|nr:MBL fold metallo-hydrolase [Aeromicrobium sp.]